MYRSRRDIKPTKRVGENTTPTTTEMQTTTTQAQGMCSPNKRYLYNHNHVHNTSAEGLANTVEAHALLCSTRPSQTGGTHTVFSDPTPQPKLWLQLMPGAPSSCTN